MSLPDARIVSQNPWWTDRAWEPRDPHLRSLGEAAVRLPSPAFVEGIQLDQPAIHVVRGPRQVGKSTGLKLLAQRAMRTGERDARAVIYLALDLLADQPLAELAAAVTRAHELADPSGPCLLLLDEVTVVPRWAEALKALWDEGALRQDVVVATGSSAIELASSATERLPGRRGSGRDFLVLPQSFAEFSTSLDDTLPSSPRLALADLFSEAGARSIRHAEVHRPKLDAALARYLVFGGLPAAVAEAAAGAPEPSQQTRRVLWDSIEREVIGRGASRAALGALLERVARSLGSKTNWSTFAREMDIPLRGRRTSADYRLVKDYVEFLGRSYLLLVLYFWKAGAPSNDLSKDKKVYFGDPLLYTLARKHAPGLAFDPPAAVENALALALQRRYEPADSQAEGYSDPATLHIWETTKPREIDFVCGPRSAVEMLEVKYQSNVGPTHTLSMRRSFPGRPAVVATREQLRLHDDYAFVPASLLLWALG